MQPGAFKARESHFEKTCLPGSAQCCISHKKLVILV